MGKIARSRTFCFTKESNGLLQRQDYEIEIWVLMGGNDNASSDVGLILGLAQGHVFVCNCD